MIYGELGITPLSVDINTRILSFWSKLIEKRNSNKLSSVVYNLVHHMDKENQTKSLWIGHVRNLLNSIGFSGFWDSQSIINGNWFPKAAKQKITDTFIHRWYTNIDITSQTNIYRIFKTDFKQSVYIGILPLDLCKKMFKFRTRNHRLPVETGRWSGIPHNNRLCSHCSEIGDEFHYLFKCSQFKENRVKYLLPYYYQRPNILKLEQLMNTANLKQLKLLCYFIDAITKNISN